MLHLNIETPYPEPSDTSLRAAETRLAFQQLLVKLGLRKEYGNCSRQKVPKDV